jgi:hypothetical protein
MKVKINIEFDVSKDQAMRFARIFRHMNFHSCRVYATNDNEAVMFLEIIDNILSELKKFYQN